MMRLPTLLVMFSLLSVSPMTNCIQVLPMPLYVPVPVARSGGFGPTFAILGSALAVNVFLRRRFTTTNITTAKTTTTAKKTTTATTTTTTTTTTTSPTVADTCPSGYRLFSAECGRFCVRLDSQNCRSWNDARAACQAEGGDLYAPNDCSFSFVKDLAQTEAGPVCRSFWIGASTSARGVPFKTVLGVTVPNDSPFWARNEPSGVDGVGNIENCADLSSYLNYAMNDAPCNSRNAFLCQRNI